MDDLRPEETLDHDFNKPKGKSAVFLVVMCIIAWCLYAWTSIGSFTELAKTGFQPQTTQGLGEAVANNPFASQQDEEFAENFEEVFESGFASMGDMNHMFLQAYYLNWLYLISAILLSLFVMLMFQRKMIGYILFMITEGLVIAALIYIAIAYNGGSFFGGIMAAGIGMALLNEVALMILFSLNRKHLS